MIKAKDRRSLKAFILLFKDAFNELIKNDPLRMAGATAFFTTFALPPILVIIIQVLGLVFDPKKISRQLFSRLSEIIGKESTHQVVDTLKAFRHMAQNWFITISGFLFLVFVATTLFKIIKSSVNQLWKIKIVHQQSMWYTLRTRLKSVLVIVAAGILFVLGIVAEGAQAYLGKYIYQLSPVVASYFNSLLNYVISIIIVTVWFALMFRYLPDGQPQWKVAFMGGFITSLLFNIGKFILHWLLGYSNIDNLYGASGSIVLLLLFVFYSSLILYYGAAFTKIWGQYQHHPIKPSHHAMHYQLTESDV